MEGRESLSDSLILDNHSFRHFSETSSVALHTVNKPGCMSVAEIAAAAFRRCFRW